MIRLESEDTKSSRRREIPLSANADAVLARRWSDWLRVREPNWNSYRSAWETAIAAVKLDNFRFHDLRHSFASWLVQRGRPMREVQEALGHASMTMTNRYAHLARENLRAAVAVLDDILPARAQAETQELREGVTEPVTV